MPFEPISDVEQLEELLSRPSELVVNTLHGIPGDVILLGIAGKMGPSLGRMIKRAADTAGTPRRVIGVSRFSGGKGESELNRHGIETIRCDLLDEEQLGKMPDAPNVFYLAGMKFGATGQESLTWAMNTYLPALVCRKFKKSRIVALSTGNIYGLTAVARGGSLETDVPSPVGEYAMSCLGRERMFEHFSRTHGIPVSLIRLNYACDLRYGVLVDLAHKIWNNQPVDLAMGFFNTVWQGDANAMIIASLAHAGSPAVPFNLTGLATLSVRTVCCELGKIMGRQPQFVGCEAGTALLSNARAATERLGAPVMPESELIQQVAHWVMRGNALLGKPTHFESRDGKF